MSITKLEYSPVSQNQRVSGFEIGGEDNPRIYDAEFARGEDEISLLIMAAYRQIFHEQHMLESNRQKALESQLRSGQISVRDFVRGLANSDVFRRMVFEVNNNYRFVELCVQRILGRQVYNDREKISRSMTIASQGYGAFINELLNSEEYLENFGDSIVPYQRRRTLPKQLSGDVPFERIGRYDSKIMAPAGQSVQPSSGNRLQDLLAEWQQKPAFGRVGKAFVYAGLATIGFAFLSILFGW